MASEVEAAADEPRLREVNVIWGEVEVLRATVDPAICELEAPFRIVIQLRSKVLQEARWQVRFLADLVHHQKSVELPLLACRSIDGGQANTDKERHCSEHCSEHVELCVAGVPAVGLPTSALESLGLLEARLTGINGELASVRLVVDVRRDGLKFQRGVLDPFR